MAKRKLPEHMHRVYGSVRAFRALKRRQLRAVRAAMQPLSFGSAYLTHAGYIALNQAEAALEKVRLELRGNWNP